MKNVRRAAVAGSWYPASSSGLAAEVDGHLARAGSREVDGEVVAVIVPHAGLMYSGPVAAHAYALLRSRRFDVAVLVGPSHFVAFDGVAIYPSGSFETPLGTAEIDDEVAARLQRSSAAIRADPGPHRREHSLEMQLPFIQRLAPGLRIVPMLMGHQTAATASRLADAIAASVSGISALLVASSDLSHYRDAATARQLDSVVIDCVQRFDPEGL